MERALHASVEGAEEVYLGEVISGPDVHYPEEAVLTQLFSIKNNLSTHSL